MEHLEFDGGMGARAPMPGLVVASLVLASSVAHKPPTVMRSSRRILLKGRPKWFAFGSASHALCAPPTFKKVRFDGCSATKAPEEGCEPLHQLSRQRFRGNSLRLSSPQSFCSLPRLPCSPRPSRLLARAEQPLGAIAVYYPSFAGLCFVGRSGDWRRIVETHRKAKRLLEGR
jgi:hypothetical protein